MTAHAAESSLSFTVGHETLRATLHVPEGESRVPAVLFLHGFTGDRNGPHRLFVDAARRLSRRGLAVLRLDFRGCGESDGDFLAVSISSMVADARAALAQLRSHPRVDAERLAVAGFSLGAAIASQVVDEAGLQAMLVWSPLVFPVPIFARMGLYAAHPELARQGWIDSNGHRVGREFLSELAPLDPLSALAAWQKPLYVLYGGQDMVATTENPEALLSEISGARGECLRDGDHVFASVPARTWLLDRTESWLAGAFAGLTVS